MNTHAEQTTEQAIPVRGIPIPQAPTPQTNFGILEHTGTLPTLEPIQDIPVSFSWMMAMPYFHSQFTVSATDAIGDELTSFNAITDTTASGGPNTFKPWASLAFTTSTYWTGIPTYRLIAIKPSRTPCKLLVVFEFKNRGGVPAFDNDALQRTIIKEWDLAQSSICEFDITGIMPTRQRPSYISTLPATPAASDLYTLGFTTPNTLYEAGRISIVNALTYQPGGIFPDSFTVLVEKAWKNFSCKTPVDPRGNYPHIMNNVTAVAPPTETPL